MLLCGIYATIPPSFCFAKIHLPLHKGGFSPAVHFYKKTQAADCRPYKSMWGHKKDRLG